MADMRDSRTPDRRQPRIAVYAIRVMIEGPYNSRVPTEHELEVAVRSFVNSHTSPACEAKVTVMRTDQ